MLRNLKFLLVVFIVTAFYKVLGQSPERFCDQAEKLVDILEKYQYQPLPLHQNQLGSRTCNLFLQAIDPRSLYLLAKDTSVFYSCRKSVEEGFASQSCGFFEQILQLYRQRLIEADTLISTILQQPFDFSVHDTLCFGDNDSLCFAANERMRAKRWRKWLKYQALQYLFFPDSLNRAQDPKSFSSREAEVRAKIKIREKRNISRILDNPEGFRTYVSSLFFNAIASGFDPHSAYFSPVEKTNFESTLATDALSYGFDIDDNPNGTVKIARLVPGGPAWKSGELHKGDILLQVKWPKGDAVDLSCSDQEEVEEILSSSGSDRMDLTVRKINGQQKTISLVKAKLEADGNLIKSFVLKGPQTIGYISLPGFYTEWENQDLAGCASDMAKEIIKLKSENVGGIILDLRNNGGGSMNEALSLAGIFLDEGPLCISRDRNEKPVVLKDKNRGTAYDGLLIIMVNGFSASASEIITGALQDYHRALVVGSPTFGKATGQIIFPLDTSVETPVATKDETGGGFVKITISKFYRLNGISSQQKGIIPDVLFPSYNEDFSYREKTLSYSLLSDTVVKKVYFNPLLPLPVGDLSRMSQERLKNDARFSQMVVVNDSLGNAWKEMKKIVLDPAVLQKKEETMYKLFQRLDDLVTYPSTLFKVANLKFDEPLLNINSYKEEVNKLALKNIQEDIYIEETYRVMEDLINRK